MIEGRRCVVCGKPQEERHRPFCSRRCADVDLNRWLSGHYVVPGASEEDDGDGASTPSTENERG